jgi:hypothetical protein
MKIRQLRPELFNSTLLTGVSYPARWLLLGLMCAADDYGYIKYDLQQIESEIYSTTAYKDFELMNMLNELWEHEIVDIKNDADHQYIYIKVWDVFQKVHPKKVSYFPDGLSFPSVRVNRNTSADSSCETGCDPSLSARPFPLSVTQVYKTMDMFCIEKNFCIDRRKLRKLAKDFWHFFTSNNWVRATGEPVGDWCARAQDWVIGNIATGDL